MNGFLVLSNVLTKGINSSVKSVTDLKEGLKVSFSDARFAHQLAQAKQFAYNERRYTSPSYTVGDIFHLSRKLITDSTSNTQPSQKLGVLQYSPFKVILLVRKNAIHLKCFLTFLSTLSFV